MKVLLISSSPRKERSQTLFLAKELLGVCASEGAETEVIHLCDATLQFCRHCEACHVKILQCPIEDDAAVIIQKMLLSDGIIFASPNYINQITASMKALFERASHLIHCKRLLGKYIVAAVTSGSGYDEPVLNYLKHCGYTFGAQFAGAISSRVPLTDAKRREAADLGKAFIEAIKDKKAFPDQIDAIEAGKVHFRKVMEQRKDLWCQEYKYWQEKGWLQ